MDTWGGVGRKMLCLNVSTSCTVCYFFCFQKNMDGEISLHVVKERIRVLFKWLILLNDQAPWHRKGWRDIWFGLTMVTKTQQRCPISRSSRTVARRSIQILIGACLKKCFTRLVGKHSQTFESESLFEFLCIKINQRHHTGLGRYSKMQNDSPSSWKIQDLEILIILFSSWKGYNRSNQSNVVFLNKGFTLLQLFEQIGTYHYLPLHPANPDESASSP